MNNTEVKISIDGLEIGMFVNRLDRPWLETPFPLEGVRVDTKKDIEMLKRYTSFVFVDVEKGHSPPSQLWITGDDVQLQLKGAEPPPINAFSKKTDNEYTKLKRCFYEITSSFDEELGGAKEIQEQVHTNIKTILYDLQHGKSLNIELMKEGVEATVGSIIRNPSAFSLLVQLHKTDDYLYSRALGTSVWCAQFGRHLGLERNELNNLALGGMLLDVGKVKLPKEILQKKEPLTAEEWEVVKTHANLGVRIIAATKSAPPEVLRMVATHHERFGGTGYPEAIKNDEISIYGRIAGIVDSYDAMTTARPHNNIILTPHEAINELYHSRGTAFQDELVEQFIQTVGLYPTGSLIELETGEVGIVLEVNDLKRLFPTVMLILDTDKKPLQEFKTINISKQENSNLKVKNSLPTNSYGIKMEELFI